MLVTSNAELDELYDRPTTRAILKCIPRLELHSRRLIAASPFLVIATSRPGGSADASPRGDRPGFVRVLDDQTLLIPDRPGNNRLDSLRNILENPQVGLIFFIPGLSETLRVNGSAVVTRDVDMLSPSAVDGRSPRTGILVSIQEIFLHCAKAVVRSRLWDVAAQVDRRDFPSPGTIQAEQIGGLDARAVDVEIAAHNTTMLY